MSYQKATKKDLFGLYIHWPYCTSKCPYCDFASTVCRDIDEDALLTTYKRDMDLFPDSRALTSVFFGGGTPSLMTLSFFEKLIGQIQKRYC